MEISADQVSLLAPSRADITVRDIIARAGGSGGKLAMPRRALDAAGGISAFCGSANDEKTIKELKAAQALAESLSAVHRAKAQAGAAAKAVAGAAAEQKKAERAARAQAKSDTMAAAAPDAIFALHEGRKLTMVQCNAIAYVHFDGAQLNPPAATTAQELEALLGTKPHLIGDHIELRVGLEFDMQFNNDARVYTGTIMKVKQLRNKTVYVCEYDDGDSVQHTEEELRVALRGE